MTMAYEQPAISTQPGTWSEHSVALNNALYRQSVDGIEAEYVTLRQRMRDAGIGVYLVPLLPQKPSVHSRALWDEWKNQAAVTIESMLTKLSEIANPPVAVPIAATDYAAAAMPPAKPLAGPLDQGQWSFEKGFAK